MKNKYIVFITATLLAVLFCFGLISASATEEGVTFSEKDYYMSHYNASDLPLTYEAIIKFPADFNPNTAGGVILSNYKNNFTSCVSFEIAENGCPKLLIIDNNKKNFTYLFKKANVYTGEALHLAITVIPNENTLKCYINGVEVQSLKAEVPDVAATTMNYPFIFGGDYKTGNPDYFKGSVSQFAMYYVTRTADQVKVDAQGKYGTNKLLGFFTAEKGKKILVNAVDSAINFVHTEPWVEKEPVKDYAYSFAVVGDPQVLTQSYQSVFVKIYDWIVENAEAKKIKHVIGLGDITNGDSMGEWSVAKKFMTTLNGVVDYSFVRGNHDSVQQFNRYFPYSEFGDTVDGSFDGTMLNTYKKFAIGKVKYLIMSLDMTPSDEVLSWADKIVGENPDYNVIIHTHAELIPNLSRYPGIWDKLARKHENVCLVLSGHEPSDLIVYKQSRATKGNTVTEILVDPQKVDQYRQGAGLLAMFYFSEDGKKLDIEYFSVLNGKYFLEENQISLELDVVETEYDETKNTDTPTTPSATTPTESNDKSNNTQNHNNVITIIAITVIAVAIIGTALLIILKKKK